MCTHKSRSMTLTLIILDDYIRTIDFGDILLEQALDKQYVMEALLRSLDTYRPQRDEETQHRK